MKRPTKGRGLFLTRDSGGQHEMTPGKYVEWAAAAAQTLGVIFTGTPGQIDAMIREGKFAEGDLFIDYDVKGNVLSRAGLDAIKAEISRDPTVSHAFIPNRDRLARPDNPLDGVQLENELRTAGVTVVFMDRVSLPIVKGVRQDISDMILSLIDYDKAGAFRQELARRIIPAQIALAQAGFSTGGRAPYGFRRWLVRVDGTPVRELADRERVRMVGHHVVWLPGPDTELELIRRILTMLEKMAASRVAAILNEEGIPSPDAGRYRTDNGVQHQVSGLWHQPTIINIARNRLLLAVATHGQRSMGDQLRMTPEGPRPLSESDYRADNEPKVIRNPQSRHITAKSASPFDPVVTGQKFVELQEILDSRAGTQRGKSRSRHPRRNPLGGRVLDMNCGWPMYRVPDADSFRYKCGLYQQSHGQRCHHNHIDGVMATSFILGCVRQCLLSSNLVAKLKTRLQQLAAAELQQDRPQIRGSASRQELDQVRRELKLAERNLAYAQNENQYRAIAEIVEELRKRETSLELATKSTPPRSHCDVDSEVEAALRLADRLTEIGNESQNLAMAKDAIDLANAKLFLTFRPVRARKRTMNKIVGGVVTLGTAPAPVALYDGTSRDKVKKRNPEAANAATEDRGRRSPTESESEVSGREGTSLGNVNRGDRI